MRILNRIEAIEARTAPVNNDGGKRLLAMLETVGARCGDDLELSKASPVEVAALALTRGAATIPGLAERVSELATRPGPVGKLFAGLAVLP